jgi:hypothetical protein
MVRPRTASVEHLGGPLGRRWDGTAASLLARWPPCRPYCGTRAKLRALDDGVDVYIFFFLPFFLSFFLLGHGWAQKQGGGCAIASNFGCAARWTTAAEKRMQPSSARADGAGRCSGCGVVLRAIVAAACTSRNSKLETGGWDMDGESFLPVRRRRRRWSSPPPLFLALYTGVVRHTPVRNGQSNSAAAVPGLAFVLCPFFFPPSWRWHMERRWQQARGLASCRGAGS